MRRRLTIHVDVQGGRQGLRPVVVQRLTREFGVDVATTQSWYLQLAANVGRATGRDHHADVTDGHVVPEPRNHGLRVTWNEERESGSWNVRIKKGLTLIQACVDFNIWVWVLLLLNKHLKKSRRVLCHSFFFCTIWHGLIVISMDFRMTFSTHLSLVFPLNFTWFDLHQLKNCTYVFLFMVSAHTPTLRLRNKANLSRKSRSSSTSLRNSHEVPKYIIYGIQYCAVSYPSRLNKSHVTHPTLGSLTLIFVRPPEGKPTKLYIKYLSSELSDEFFPTYFISISNLMAEFPG